MFRPGALSVLLLASTVVADFGNYEQHKEVFVFDILKDNLPSQVTCNANQCSDTIWCVNNPSRPLFKMVDIWSQVHFIVSSEHGNTSLNGVKVVAESSDSSFGVHFFKNLWYPSEDVSDKLRNKRDTDRNAISILYEHLFSSNDENQTVTAIGKEFSPFGKSCIRIDIDKNRPSDIKAMKISVRKAPLVLKFPIQFMIGIFVIALAPFLSNWLLFYYAIGISFGVVWSMIAVGMILSRLIPNKKSIMGFALAVQGGFFYMFMHMQKIAEQHANVLIWYFSISALLSFAFTHYLLKTDSGPSGPSTGMKDIVRWAMQGIGYGFLLNSSASSLCAFSVALTVFLILWLPIFGNKRNNTPASWKNTFTKGNTNGSWRNPSRNRSRQVFGGGGNGEAEFHDIDEDDSRDRYLLDEDDPAPAMERTFLSGPLLSKKEFELEGQVNTRMELEKLNQSPAFVEWILKNSHRIRVERDEDELEEY